MFPYQLGDGGAGADCFGEFGDHSTTDTPSHVPAANILMVTKEAQSLGDKALHSFGIFAGGGRIRNFISPDPPTVQASALIEINGVIGSPFFKGTSIMKVFILFFYSLIFNAVECEIFKL